MNPPNSLALMLERLYGRINYEKQHDYVMDQLKLQNMQRILRILNDPHLSYPVLHIAGTKGKGSVAAMLGRVMAETGRKTGVYSSPHLETINQRIVIDDQPISDGDLLGVLEQVEGAATLIDDQYQTDPAYRKITFFEVITAAGFLQFANQKVDVAVIEVGMGGRLDSTNVCQPMLSIITSISFDHMQHLGDTLPKIAREKAGIIKSGVPVICGVSDGEAQAAISEIARQKSSRLYQLGIDFHLLPSPKSHAGESVSNVNRFSVQCDFDQNPYRFDGLKSGMLGGHQQQNGAIVVAACEVLNRAGWKILQPAIRQGIAKACLPGRTEIVGEAPTIMLDIAHNAASIEALVNTLAELPGWQSYSNRVLVLAISKDKKHHEMLEKLAPFFDAMIFTRFQNNPRCRDPRELMQQTEQILMGVNRSPILKVIDLPQQAYAEGIQLAGPEGFLCIAGSVYLIAEVRTELTKTSIPSL